MWFDVSVEMARLQSSDLRPNLFRMTEKNALKVAEIAEVAALSCEKPKPVSAMRSDGLNYDAGAYLDYLHLHGPSTYGAFATALGWGATRAWQAEAHLRAAGLVRHDSLGKLRANTGNFRL